MRILRAGDRIDVPWKNGGGVTREVCTIPEGAGFDFGWRLSIAEVHASGPFSRFAGVDRKLAVLSGRMTLAIDRAAPVEISAGASALAFSGDVETVADVSQPVMDVNLMTRRDIFRGTLDRVSIDGAVTVADEDAETVIVALDPLAGSVGTLAVLDALWCGPGVPATIQPVEATATILLARIWRVNDAER